MADPGADFVERQRQLQRLRAKSEADLEKEFGFPAGFLEVAREYALSTADTAKKYGKTHDFPKRKKVNDG